MVLEVDIKKKMGSFNLKVSFQSTCKCMGILGASGSGKSMILKCIAGIVEPDEGRIVLNGEVFFDSNDKINKSPQNRKVGYLFQNYALFPTMTVLENIKTGIKGNKEYKRELVKEQVRLFHLEGLEKRYPEQLSGGQQQRVALARIMAYRPQIIMLDEPFSAIDSFLKDILHKELLEILKNFNGNSILVSHSRDEVFKFCNSLTIMDEGRITVCGRTKDLFNNPLRVNAAKVTGCKNISKIRKVNNYELEALEWGVLLKTNQVITEKITHVGIRARHLLTVDQKKENTMKVDFLHYAESPFDVQYMFRNSMNDLTKEIWWITSKKQFHTILQDIPKYIQFPAERLMLLES
ncbi:ATP-binding cassette domain-containing protein [Anaerosacchariphilus polymeriproducens]|uniref:ATP-binding cassette domain-containing protein n=1 Tax=Anaerosacchariphilus polymeriproducens TaxID=1812858 RepID=A0A371AUD7_9FIRM|nr:ATP-binding cassette domain-containing protein [Anaerosacchariphilus polymeriproducens]